MIFKSRFAEWFVRIFLPIATFLSTGFVTSELLLADEPPEASTLATWNVEWFYDDLVVQGEVDQNHRDGYYKMPQNERDIGDHYPLVTEFVFK